MRPGAVWGMGAWGGGTGWSGLLVGCDHLTFPSLTFSFFEMWGHFGDPNTEIKQYHTYNKIYFIGYKNISAFPLFICRLQRQMAEVTLRRSDLQITGSISNNGILSLKQITCEADYQSFVVLGFLFVCFFPYFQPTVLALREWNFLKLSMEGIQCWGSLVIFCCIWKTFLPSKAVTPKWSVYTSGNKSFSLPGVLPWDISILNAFLSEDSCCICSASSKNAVRLQKPTLPWLERSLSNGMHCSDPILF